MRGTFHNAVRKVSSAIGFFTLCAFLIAGSPAGHAQSITWSGSTSPLWNVNGNWFGGTQPGSANTVVFDSTSMLKLTGTLGTNFSVAGVTVGSTPGNITISGNTLNLGTGGIDMSSASNSTNNLTIASLLNFNATSNITVATGRTFTPSNTTAVTSGTVTLNGQGTVATGGINVGASLTQTAGLIVQSGTLTTASNVYVGAAFAGSTTAVGTFKNQGGTFNHTAASIFLGQNGLGSFLQESGTSTISQLRISPGNGGNGILSVSGGNLSITSLSQIATGSNSQARFILSGGTTTLPAIVTTRGSGATADITFDGGVLRPTATSPTYMQAGVFTNAWLTNNGALFDTNSFNITITQVLANSSGANGTLTKQGAGALTLAGENTYSGNTTVSTGTLALAHVNALQNSTLNTGVSGGQSVTFTLSGSTYNLGGLAGADDLAITGSNIISVGANNATTSYSGVIGGAGGAVIKTGSGTLTLSGSSSYTGATAISAGRLEVAAGGRINSTSRITLAGVGAELKYNSTTALTAPITFTQGTISGTGTIGTAVTVGGGDILSPGNSPGSQAYTSGLAWNPGGTYEWETNALSGTTGTNWDVIAVSGGALDLSGLSSGNRFVLDLTTLGAGDTPGSLVGGYEPGTYAFDIATFSSLLVPDGYTASANSILTDLFSFNELVNWQGTQPSSLALKVNSSGNGLQLNLVIVPEPTAVAIAGMGILLAGWSLVRRRGKTACHPE
jgi:autotransporter-associated beta strand protein